MKLPRVWPVQIEGYSYRDLSPSALFSLLLLKEYLKFAKPEISVRFIPSGEILHPDILEFIYFQVNASRKATGVLCVCARITRSTRLCSPLLRCLSDEQLSEVEVTFRKNRWRQKFHNTENRFSGDVSLFKVNERKSMRWHWPHANDAETMNVVCGDSYSNLRSCHKLTFRYWLNTRLAFLHICFLAKPSGCESKNTKVAVPCV